MCHELMTHPHCILQLIELGECLHAVFMVDDAACFAATVHGEDGITHIHTLQWDGRGEDVAQGASACHIAMVHEALARNTGSLADVGEDGCRYGIAGILLCRIKLDDRTTAQHRMIRWVKLLAVVRMPGMSVIGRNHEGTLHSLIISLLCMALSQGDALEHIRKEWASGTLLGLRACLLVVENGENTSGVR